MEVLVMRNRTKLLLIGVIFVIAIHFISYYYLYNLYGELGLIIGGFGELLLVGLVVGLYLEIKHPKSRSRRTEGNTIFINRGRRGDYGTRDVQRSYGRASRSAVNHARRMEKYQQQIDPVDNWGFTKKRKKR